MPSSPAVHAKYMREVWYPRNRKKHCAMAKRWRDAQHATRRAKVATLKKAGCACGEKHIACLEFHHKDRTQKEGNLAYAFRSWSDERLAKEIEKCVVICSNCHRKLHWRERNGD